MEMAGDEEDDDESLFTLETRKTYSHLRELNSASLSQFHSSLAFVVCHVCWMLKIIKLFSCTMNEIHPLSSILAMHFYFDRTPYPWALPTNYGLNINSYATFLFDFGICFFLGFSSWSQILTKFFLSRKNHQISLLFIGFFF
jgi:hypothetical protein